MAMKMKGLGGGGTAKMGRLTLLFGRAGNKRELREDCDQKS